MKLRACFRRPGHRLQSGLRAIMKFHITSRHRFWRKKAPDGRPQKRSFGAWFDFASQGLARLRFLRETPLDPFGYSAERRMERQLIKDFESLVGADAARV